MGSDRTDLNPESRSTLLILEHDSAVRRFRLTPSCSRRDLGRLERAADLVLDARLLVELAGDRPLEPPDHPAAPGRASPGGRLQAGRPETERGGGGEAVTEILGLGLGGGQR